MLIALTFLVAANGNALQFDLKGAIDYALTNNPELQQLTIEFEKSQTKTAEALSAFYPSLTASGYYAYITDIPVLDFDGAPVPLGQSENYNVEVSLQQVLFTWGKLYNAYRISDFSQKIAELSLARKKQEIRYSVTDAFYGLLFLEQMTELARENLNQLNRHVEVVQTRYKAGLVSQFDLMRAQVQIANVKPQVIEAENGLKLAREGFKMLLGLPLESDFQLAGELVMTTETFDLEELTKIALENRIELKNLRNIESIARLGKSIAATANLPSLVGGATYSRTKPFGFATDEWGSNITFNIGFQWAIFTGFKNLAQYRAANLALKEARLGLENLEKAISFEVKQAYFNFLAAQEAIVAAQDNTNQAEKTFEIIETRYKNGLATNLEFLDVQLALMQAKANYLAALQKYHAARAGIYKAIGKEE